MTPHPERMVPVKLRITFYEDGRAEVFTPIPRPVAEVVALLRQAADEWEDGSARRIL